MEMRPGHLALEIGDDLTIPADEFRIQALNSAGAASPEDRAGADFIAAFGCDAVADRRGRIQDTALRTLSGAGHQHFLRTMRELAERTAGDNLRRCLFAPWDRPDTLYSLRWDPEDDRRYAHRWRDPSKETAGTEWGATAWPSRPSPCSRWCRRPVRQKPPGSPEPGAAILSGPGRYGNPPRTWIR